MVVEVYESWADMARYHWSYYQWEMVLIFRRLTYVPIASVMAMAPAGIRPVWAVWTSRGSCATEIFGLGCWAKTV